MTSVFPTFLGRKFQLASSTRKKRVLPPIRQWGRICQVTASSSSYSISVRVRRRSPASPPPAAESSLPPSPSSSTVSSPLAVPRNGRAYLPLPSSFSCRLPPAAPEIFVSPKKGDADLGISPQHLSVPLRAKSFFQHQCACAYILNFFSRPSLACLRRGSWLSK